MLILNQQKNILEENMKNFLKITGIVLLVIFAASCSNGLLQTTFNNEANDNGQCLVSFSITDILPHSRTIMPDNFGFGERGEKARRIKKTECETLFTLRFVIFENKCLQNQSETISEASSAFFCRKRMRTQEMTKATRMRAKSSR